MNEQEIFNFVVPKMLEQNCKSEDDEMCLYRGPNNTRCPVGFLIPDELYNEDMEEDGPISSNEGIWEVFFAKGIIDEKDRYKISPFLSDLQDVHDNHAVDEWQRWLILLADHHGLDASCIQ